MLGNREVELTKCSWEPFAISYNNLNDLGSLMRQSRFIVQLSGKCDISKNRTIITVFPNFYLDIHQL